MPELPEVETVKRGLQKFLTGRVVSSIKFDWPKGFPNAKVDVDKFLIGATVTEVKRRAKVLIIELSTNYTLVIHLKMTGQLVFVGNESRWGGGHPNDSLINQLPDKSTRVIFDFADGSKLFFNDQRKFGWIRLLPTAEVPNIEFMKKVGPEPLSKDFNASKFIKRIKRRANSKIKATLLDQTAIAGIGNIYADEALFLAKLHPAQVVYSISDYKLTILFNSIKEILNQSISKGGSSSRNYVNAEGKRGEYLNFANVFKREGKPCMRCGEQIIKIRVVGRGTHICPREQRLITKK